MGDNNIQQVSIFADYSAYFWRIIFSVKRKIVQYLAGILIISFFLPNLPKAEEIIWPINSTKAISSSFGEPRSGRFHYGVDFKSGAVTGKEVYSIGDGYISRVKTSPFGYGKALYILLDSGKTVVYGHLSKFLPEIEDRLFKMRYQKDSYDLVWYPRIDEFRVRKGQVVAYSGDTGSGPPHLHFEIRDENENPLNPLNQGLVVDDKIPPHINSAALIPLDNKSSVDGFPVTRWYDFSSPDKNPIYLSGRIGVAVSVWDRVNRSNNLVGIYQISLAVDSTIVFSKSYEKLSYSPNGSGKFDYLSGKYYGGNGHISALFRRIGNLLSFYDGNGILVDNTPESTDYTNITICAEDYADNRITCTIPVAFGKRPTFLYCGYNGSGKLRIAGTHDSGNLDHAELWKYNENHEYTLEHNYPIEGAQCDIEVELPLTQTKYNVILVAHDSTQSLPATLECNPAISSKGKQSGLKISTDMLHDRIVIRISSKELLASIPIVQFEINGAMDNQILWPVPDGETSWITSIALPKTVNNHLYIKASAYDQAHNRILAESEIDFAVLNPSTDTTVYAPDSLLTIDVSPGT